MHPVGSIVRIFGRIWKLPYRMDLNYTEQVHDLQYTVVDYVRSAINDAS